MKQPIRLGGPIARMASCILACLAAPGDAAAQPAPSPQRPAAIPGDAEAAIRAATRRYLDALARGDAATLAALWTPDGDIVDDEGQVVNGREAVGRITAPTGDAVRIRDTRLRLLTADVAIEDGTVETTPPGTAEPHRGWFSATWVRQEGDWKLAGLRESRISPPQPSSRLDDLAWMVGDWTAEEAGVDAGDRPAGPRPRIEFSVRWNPTHTFLVREMTITPPAEPGQSGDGQAVTQVTQRIGWDPLSKQIVSWVFGSDGSHGEATWSRDDAAWIARTMVVLPDGTQTSFLNIYVYDGADRCAWRSIPTHVGGEHAPQISMTMVRKKPEPAHGARGSR